MKKIYLKLISVALALILFASVVIASSYAWMVLSANPVTTGIQVSIGGGNTILIAPDIRETAQDGNVYHYPGVFQDKLNFGQHSAYEYLQQLGNLNPVSTVNGIDWILPEYYSGADAQVQNGLIPSGSLKDITEFSVDSELVYANLPAEEEDKIHEGHYVYLDFWVVSPGGDYTLRVSSNTDEQDGGSFVIDLPEPSATDLGYTFQDFGGGVCPAVRVGFLTNSVGLTDDTMLSYRYSDYYDERFFRLKGLLREPNTGTAYLEEDRFTIYEPNGNSHPGDPQVDGTYVETKPLGLINDRIAALSVENNLTMQTKSDWKKAQTGSSTLLEQHLQAALFAHSTDGMSTEEVYDLFYNQYLQGQLSLYVNKGSFMQETQNLYTALQVGGGTVPADTLSAQSDGATDDVYIIELEKNVPQRIRMFIWMEGQDIDCVDSIGSSRFAVNIEFAGGDE